MTHVVKPKLPVIKYLTVSAIINGAHWAGHLNRIIEKFGCPYSNMNDAMESSGISILSKGWSGRPASVVASSTSRADFEYVCHIRHPLCMVALRIINSSSIVAVHGLLSHGFNSWAREKGEIWLKDMLPGELPDARIMAFRHDYNSTTKKSFSASSISEIALDLLDSLGSKRTTQKVSTLYTQCRTVALIFRRIKNDPLFSLLMNLGVSLLNRLVLLHYNSFSS